MLVRKGMSRCPEFAPARACLRGGGDATPGITVMRPNQLISDSMKYLPLYQDRPRRGVQLRTFPYNFNSEISPITRGSHWVIFHGYQLMCHAFLIHHRCCNTYIHVCTGMHNATMAYSEGVL